MNFKEQIKLHKTAHIYNFLLIISINQISFIS